MKLLNDRYRTGKGGAVLLSAVTVTSPQGAFMVTSSKEGIGLFHEVSTMTVSHNAWI